MIESDIQINEIEHHPVGVEEEPFRHIYVRDFFKKSFYEALVKHFMEVKSQGLAEKFDTSIFSRFSGYDAYCWIFPPESTYPLNLFYSQEWRQYFSQLFDLPLSHDVVAEYHHHKVGSKTGFVHNDYNEVCFKQNYLANGINPWYYECSFDPKNQKEGETDVMNRMRSIAIIYYFCNEPWQEGDGGETGLYTLSEHFSLFKAIPPESNSIMAFEITPTSYHGFIHNNRLERNSIIMWLHSETDVKLERHDRVPPVPFN